MLRFPRFSYSAMPLVGLGAIAIALGSVPVVQAQTPPAIVAQAENAERYIRLAVEEYQEGNNQAALDALNQAIALNPTMADIYILRGIVRSELNDPQGAIADYSEAIELDGDDAEVYIVRGLAQLALKQYQAVPKQTLIGH
uniref:Tetratricopeptide repeat protein n=1 Tax=Desertifilum tharense IPPAS B-1220 TaxID=1781255 RepID=A0ACD5GTM0_9CYAN